MKYLGKQIEKNIVTEPLIYEIEQFVETILNGNISQIPYKSYVQFYKLGSRKEFEEVYFERRKQLTALGLYLQWNNSKKAIEYFQELLWTICNEFSWCLAAHLPYGEDNFKEEPSKIIDLFSAETAQTLCELLIIHEDKIDRLLHNHIKKQIEDRVIYPFINRNWEWETATHNWSAVCGSCIGIVALLMEKEEKQKLILDKVEKALNYYISGFGNDGVTLEGIGYWSYGFGYYIYYKALKDEIYHIGKLEKSSKIKSIANFPQCIQISDEIFLPFSDVPPKMALPSGLITHLYKEFNIELPSISKISSFDFDHCYRWAHVSRNLWWTSEEILNKGLKNISCYFADAEWMVDRREKKFFAIKGGSNCEPHNHNDIGSFVIAIDGEIILSDLGAGAYTREYFGKERYTYKHTRSYWHSVPLINNNEQEEMNKRCDVIKHNINSDYFQFELELSSAYPLANLNNYYRRVKFENSTGMLTMEDDISGKGSMSINEGFVSYIEPKVLGEGKIIWRGKRGNLILYYDFNKFDYLIEKEQVRNHYNELVTIYRLGLLSSDEYEEFKAEFNFYCEFI